MPRDIRTLDEVERMFVESATNDLTTTAASLKPLLRPLDVDYMVAGLSDAISSARSAADRLERVLYAFRSRR